MGKRQEWWHVLVQEMGLSLAVLESKNPDTIIHPIAAPCDADIL